MEMYLLKSALCLLIFFAFYKGLLETTSLHKFKRGYLLATLLLSFVIPFITFTTYITTTDPVETSAITNVITAEMDNSEHSKSYLVTVLWTIYLIGAIIFSFRFFRNLWRLVKRIRYNPKLRVARYIHVLITERLAPHTFFSYIFLNRKDFENDAIPQEVIIHEAAHVKELHSIDLLIIEILAVVFWFNPLVYYIKHAIKLNHEFLADNAVIRKGADKIRYQHTLLAFSSNASSPQLANSINYSSIKKRFAVMKNRTSKRGMWLRSVILFPLLAILIYGFSSREIIEKNEVSNFPIEETTLLSNEYSSEKHTARSISIEVVGDGIYIVDNLKATKNSLVTVVNSLHQDITPEIRNRIMNIHISGSKEISNEEVWFIYNSLLDYGFYRMVTSNQEVIRAKGNTPFAIEKNNLQTSATRDEMREYNTLTKKYNEMPKGKRMVKLKDLKRLESIYNKMSPKQKADVQPFTEFLPPPPPSPPGHDKANSNVPPPPPPPAPPAPLDHIVSMAKKGATFFYEEKEISSDDAIDLLKKQPELNIQTTKVNSKAPIVRISKKPYNSQD